MPFYKGIDHVNSTNDEETILKLQSTEAEKKKVIKIRITSETNDGRLKAYVDRENHFEGNTYHKTNQATIENFLEIMIDRELVVGEEFSVTLQNEVAGVNAEITGDVVYDIIP